MPNMRVDLVMYRYNFYFIPKSEWFFFLFFLQFVVKDDLWQTKHYPTVAKNCPKLIRHIYVINLSSCIFLLHIFNSVRRSFEERRNDVGSV